MLSLGNPVCMLHLEHMSVWTSHVQVLQRDLWLVAPTQGSRLGSCCPFCWDCPPAEPSPLRSLLPQKPGTLHYQML